MRPASSVSQSANVGGSNEPPSTQTTRGPSGDAVQSGAARSKPPEGGPAVMLLVMIRGWTESQDDVCRLRKFVEKLCRDFFLYFTRFVSRPDLYTAYFYSVKQIVVSANIILLSPFQKISKFSERLENDNNTPARTRTWNLRLRRATPYPLGHKGSRA